MTSTFSDPSVSPGSTLVEQRSTRSQGTELHVGIPMHGSERQALSQTIESQISNSPDAMSTSQINTNISNISSSQVNPQLQTPRN